MDFSDHDVAVARAIVNIANNKGTNDGTRASNMVNDKDINMQATDKKSLRDKKEIGSTQGGTKDGDDENDDDETQIEYVTEGM